MSSHISKFLKEINPEEVVEIDEVLLPSFKLTVSATEISKEESSLDVSPNFKLQGGRLAAQIGLVAGKPSAHQLIENQPQGQGKDLGGVKFFEKENLAIVEDEFVFGVND
mmetsp:Transcript_41444/g.63227  ORF Transcript_41444/g.63227 Transcript_41444/m.63227 type:complete len:110 (+) Transcript_41444:3198-3527(+)|eukprot:CAMPEP_0170483072 /NCGR_PEP_ID=MMETSP0208-20121228/2808_1 /TAXON_ID=197538 /ORGANISM="Strombidium inclinatum, Strain S3" /LENGTH=109 /DNA_ID=CAMNT_0010755975 /DNA_START=689 /DNA_END=1018 /DNA_ORIENTATION=-